MERNGIVSSNMGKSPVGPKRRLYFLKQSACLTIIFSPHLYNEQIFTFETLPSNLPKDSLTLLEKLAETHQSEKSNRVETWGNLIAEIAKKLQKIENEKAVLLYIRNLTMKQACEILNSQERARNEKRILYFILDERNCDVEALSKALNLRGANIREILEKLKNDLPPSIKFAN
jgi:predicted transcriptional regulator